MSTFLGIDYGSKMTGTTVICWQSANKLHFFQSQPKQNADTCIKEIVKKLQPNCIFIDAPLSLPKAYYGKGNDFFYRMADKTTQAMSPMFLGGLTARAMRLKYDLEQEYSLSIIETYPSQLLKILFPSIHITKKTAVEGLYQSISEHLPFSTYELPTNRHQLDAILAWLSGWRHLQGQSISYGEEEEGKIIV